MSIGSNIASYLRTALKGTTPAGTLTSVAIDANTQALHTQLTAGSATIGTVNTADPDQFAAGTLTASDVVMGIPDGKGTLMSGASTAGSVVALAMPGGDSGWIIQLTGTFSGGYVYFEGSIDSTTGTDGSWINVNARMTGVVNTALGYSTAVAGEFRGNTSGLKYLRVRMVGAASPNVGVVIRSSGGVGAIFLNASIPAGDNIIGSVRLKENADSALLDQLAVDLLTAILVELRVTNTLLTQQGQVRQDDPDQIRNDISTTI